MNNYLQLIMGPNSIRLGWALIHFLWQGLLIVSVLEIGLAWAGRKNSFLRYFLCGFALAVMPFCLMGTYWILGQATTVTPLQTVVSGAVSANTVSSPDKIADTTLWPVVQVIRQFASREVLSSAANHWMPAIVVAWFVGILVLAGRKAGGFIVLWRLQRREVSIPSDALTKIFQQACVKIGIDPRRVCLKISNLVRVPMTMGWLRPVILFPASLLSGLGAEEIELLISHELAHIRRWDYLVNLLQTLVETLFFYHPVTWWISRRMRQERENCCDDLVAARSADALTYAKALLQLESIRASDVSLATAANGGSLLQRIQRLIGEPAPSSGIGLPVLLILILTLGLLAFFSKTEAQTNSSGTLPATITPEEAQQIHASVFKDGKPIFEGADRVAAWVNGHPILEVSIKQQIATVEKTMKEEFSGNDLKEKLELARRNVLTALIERELIIEKFKLEGKNVPKSYIDERINDVMNAEYGGDRDAFLKTIGARGTNLENYRAEIEDTAIVGYMRNRNVVAKIDQYYFAHPELFPQDEQVSVNFVQLRGSRPATPDEMAGHVPNSDPQVGVAHQIWLQMKAGADVSDVSKKYPVDVDDNGKPKWVSKGRVPGWWPFAWDQIAEMRPGQTTDVVTKYADYAMGDGPSRKYPYYMILRVDERRPARGAATEETTRQEEALLNAEAERLKTAWSESLRANAKIQIVTQP